MATVIPTPSPPWWQFWKAGVIAKDEAWVISRIHSLEKGFGVLATEVDAAMTWVLNHQAQILQDVAGLIGIVTVTGLSANPAVAAAITAAQEALAAVAAYQAAKVKGASTALALAGAYKAAKDAQIAHAQAAQIVAGGKLVATAEAAAAQPMGLLSMK